MVYLQITEILEHDLEIILCQDSGVVQVLQQQSLKRFVQSQRKKGPKYLFCLLELPVGSVLLPLVQVFDHWVNNRLLIIAFCQIAKGTTSISLVSNGVIQWLASI